MSNVMNSSRVRQRTEAVEYGRAAFYEPEQGQWFRTYDNAPISQSEAHSLLLDLPPVLTREPHERRYKRAEARIKGERSYEDRCSIHDLAPHSVAHGKCLRCFTTQGLARTRDYVRDTTRIAARKAGAGTFVSYCSIHGDYDHHTIRGLCLGCYNSLGQPRPKSTNRAGVYVDKNGEIQEAP